MSYEEIAKTIIDEAVATDAAETEDHGNRLGDDLPEIVATAQGRNGWLRVLRPSLDRHRARQARPTKRSRPIGLLEAGRRLEEELEAERIGNERYEAYRALGRMKNGRRFAVPPKPYAPPNVPPGTVNLTDHDSRLVHGMRGWARRPPSSRSPPTATFPGRHRDTRGGAVRL